MIKYFYFPLVGKLYIGWGMFLDNPSEGVAIYADNTPYMFLKSDDTRVIYVCIGTKKKVIKSLAKVAQEKRG